MYCNGDCKYLNSEKHKCLLTGEKLAFMKQTGSVSFSIHEHTGFCEKDDSESELSKYSRPVSL